MYPVATSFIPINVALAKFIESHGFDGNYPLWYLGVVPVKYLMGPVVPWVLILLHKLLPGFSFFDLSFLLLIASYLLQAIGWGFLAFKLSGQKRIGQVVFALSLVLPWHIFYSMAFGEVSNVFASALTPYLLAFFYWKLQNRLAADKKRSTGLESNSTTYSRLAQASASSGTKENHGTFVKAGFVMFLYASKPVLITSALFTLLLLVNSTAVVPAVVGLIILGAVGAKHWEEGLKQAGMVIFLGWLLSLFWYGPGYWLAVWGAPSFGSRNAGESLIWLLTLLREFVPVFLAVFVVVFGLKKRSLFEKFALSWLASFGFLTLVRFWANPAFWLDWTAWVSEIEIGLALLFASWIYDLRFTIYESKAKIFLNPKSLIIILLFTVGWSSAFVNRQLWLPKVSIDDRVEYKIAQELKKIVQPGESVFLSGTTAFWLNALTDVKQVRGGRDEVARDLKWRQLVWEIRNDPGIDGLAFKLQSLGVGYLVVHGEGSREFYHDFLYPDKFEGASEFHKIYERNGDIIYKIKE